MRFGSLFTGIGGFDLGLERAGMECAWQVEIDDYATRVLEKHWPEVTRYRDIREIDWETVERPDLVCGGFPCQPVSLAGKGLAQDDPRWLWPEFERCLRVLRPRYVIVENVPGLLGRGMGDILGQLSAIGYDAEWESIPAAAFGLPHIRERVYLVAYSDSLRLKGRSQLHGDQAKEGCAPSWDDAQRLRATQWATRAISDEERDHDGIHARVDRLRCLGNAVVPQVAEWIGRRIIEVERAPNQA